MSNDEFDTWLSLVGRLLGLSERQRKQIGAELRDHLESRVADLLESGMDKKTAVMQAVEEFGDAAVLAKNLQSVSMANRKRWMMRFMTLATAAMFMVAVLTMAMWPENARFGSPSQSVAQDENPFGSAPPAKPAVKAKPSARTMSNEEIRDKLNQPVDLIYDAEPFGDVRAQLVKELKINIVIDGNLEGVLDDNTEVSANLSGVCLSDGLRMLLSPVDATYTIKNGVLLVISIDDEYEPDYLSRHMIDAREILKLIKTTESDRLGKPMISVPVVHSGGDGKQGGGGGGVFCVTTQQFGPQRKNELVLAQKPEEKERSESTTLWPVLTAEKLLVDTLTHVVCADAWEVNGGGNSDLTCIGGVLVVTTSELVAQDVRDFITDLEYQMKNRKD